MEHVKTRRGAPTGFTVLSCDEATELIVGDIDPGLESDLGVKNTKKKNEAEQKPSVKFEYDEKPIVPFETEDKKPIVPFDLEEKPKIKVEDTNPDGQPILWNLLKDMDIVKKDERTDDDDDGVEIENQGEDEVEKPLIDLTLEQDTDTANKNASSDDCSAMLRENRSLKNQIHMPYLPITSQPKSTSIKRKRNIPCALCDATFKHTKQRGTHERNVHGLNKGDGYRCHQCGRVCKCPAEFKRHLFSHSNMRAFPCDHCGNFYKSERSLKYHMAMIGERHECTVCGKGFSTIQSLTDHCERIHSMKNVFQCELCNKAYYTKKDLDRHVKAVHEKHLNSPARCDLCGKQYAGNMLLQKHKRYLHSRREFSCHDCSAVFKDK